MGNAAFGIAASASFIGVPPAALSSVSDSGLPIVAFHTPGATSVQRGVKTAGSAARARLAKKREASAAARKCFMGRTDHCWSVEGPDKRRGALDVKRVLT